MDEKETDQNKNIYKIDKAHSNIGFKVKHMMVARVNGRFSSYEATLQLRDEKFEHAQLDFTAETASINTNNHERDEHLRSPDFFNASTYPEIKFSSHEIKKQTDKLYKVGGYLQMNGIKSFVSLKVEYNGILKDPDGIYRIPLTIKGKINRLDWNMKWNKPLESGGILVSKEVDLIVECEFI